MEMSSPELQAFIDCNAKLISAIKTDVTPVTSRCLAKGLIPESVEDRTLSTGVTDSEKATLIVRCVRGKIKENPLHYDDFIDVLKEGGSYYKELIETLQQRRSPSQHGESHNGSSRNSNSHVGSSGSSNTEGGRVEPVMLQSSYSGTEMRRDNSSISSSISPDVIMSDSITRQSVHHDSSSTSDHIDSPDSVMDFQSQGTVPTAHQTEVNGGANEMAEFNRHNVEVRIKNVKKIRTFGNMLKIEPGKLNEIFSGPPEEIKTRIVNEWFNLAAPTAWEDLTRVLKEPALSEKRIVWNIERELSKDSAVDMTSPKSSFSSSSEPIPREYQISFIEDIGRRTDKCTISSVLNCIAVYSEWPAIGHHLNICRPSLDYIMQTNPPEDRPAYMVEEWWRSTTESGFTWTTLKKALMDVRVEKSRQIWLRRDSSLSDSLYSPMELSSSLTRECQPYTRALNIWKKDLEDDHLTDSFTDEKASETIEALEDTFTELKLKILSILDDRSIKVRDLRKTVRASSNKIPRDHYSLVNATLQNPRIKSADELFGYLSAYWNFLDYYLLEAIIKTHAKSEPTLNGSMKEYARKLKSFRTKINVAQFMRLWENDYPSRPKESFYELIATLDIDPCKCTLEHLDVLRRKILQDINLFQAALVLCELKQGCLIVTWVVLPAELVELLCEAFRKCITEGTFLKENAIISLELGGKIFKTMERMLLDASREGKDRELDKMLDKWNKDKHNLDETDKDGKTALMSASELGHNGVIVSLLEANASINYQTEDKKCSALFFASREKNHYAVKLLLEYGADAELKDRDGIAAINMPFTKEVMSSLKKKRTLKSSLDTVMKLLPFQKKKKDLLHLCKIGDFEAVQDLLQGKDDVDVNVRDVNNKDFTPLMHACQKGYFEIAEILIRYRADIHLKANDDFTALFLACANDFVRITNLLLRKEARLNQVMSKKNYTPISWISDLGYVEVARALLKHRADLSIPIRENGWTPLIQATHYGQKALVELYLEYNADVNYRAKKGWTALMEAARKGRKEIAEILVKNGAQLDIVMEGADKQTGESAVHVASYMGTHDVANVLVENGAEVNKANEVGLTPLMLAISRGKVKVVATILEKSKTIDLNIPQKDTGLPALFLAARKGHLKIFELMLQHGAYDEIESFSVLDVTSRFKRGAFAGILEKHKVKLASATELQPPERLELLPPERLELQPPERLELQPPEGLELQPSEREVLPVINQPSTTELASPIKELYSDTVPTLTEEEPTSREETLPYSSLDKEEEITTAEIQTTSGLELLGQGQREMRLTKSREDDAEDIDILDATLQETSHVGGPQKDSTDVSSLYDAKEFVQSPSQMMSGADDQQDTNLEILDSKEDRSKSTEKPEEMKKEVPPSKYLDLKSMDIKQRVLLFERITKEYDIYMRSQSNYDSSDLNEDSASGKKGVKQVEQRQQQHSQELIMNY